jgi:dTDP-4-amino-4,6-dideoxygalactose transaminase
VINVTKTFLPSFDEYSSILKRAWDKSWITNNGELVLELEKKLQEYLQVRNLLYCTNGTIALQIALKALNISKDVITTPFSYVATTNAILWENCNPVFVDINPNSFCIDSDKIESAITENTQAILATHVYGFPCDVDKIEILADKYNLKIIYDGAHAFGCTFKGKSLLSFGDVTTCSFHATKVFHTVEGGAIISKSKEIFDKLYLYRQFGHIYDDYLDIGINAKNSEFHAAMGLCLLPKITEIIASRRRIFDQYNALLSDRLSKSHIPDNLVYNYAYYPVVFPEENLLLKTMEILKASNILCRRYFYPSLNKLSFLEYRPCPWSEDISKKVLCLPSFYGLEYDSIEKICSIINSVLNNL